MNKIAIHTVHRRLYECNLLDNTLFKVAVQPIITRIIILFTLHIFLRTNRDLHACDFIYRHII